MTKEEHRGFKRGQGLDVDNHSRIASMSIPYYSIRSFSTGAIPIFLVDIGM